jgi:hypothetical protein
MDRGRRFGEGLASWLLTMTDFDNPPMSVIASEAKGKGTAYLFVSKR